MKDYELVLEHRLPCALSKEAFSLGLMEFARRPHNYIEALTDCKILKEEAKDGAKVLYRKLTFPSFSFEDVLTIKEGELREEVPAIGEMTSSRFSIRFEAGNANQNTILFTYHEKEKTVLPENIKKLREAAWIAKDKQFIEKLEAQFGLGSN